MIQITLIDIQVSFRALSQNWEKLSENIVTLPRSNYPLIKPAQRTAFDNFAIIHCQNS